MGWSWSAHLQNGQEVLGGGLNLQPFSFEAHVLTILPICSIIITTVHNSITTAPLNHCAHLQIIQQPK